MAYKKTYNPCDDCPHSFSKNNQESDICKICEFKKLLDKYHNDTRALKERDTEEIKNITEQIAKDICKDNKICTCNDKDGHCTSVMVIAERLAEQGYKPPQAHNT